MAYRDVVIEITHVALRGRLRIPEACKGFILFSHGSGSSRLSSRNNFVAGLLLEKGYASLLFDLLTESEDSDYGNRFDIDLLTDRLVMVTEWVLRNRLLNNWPLAYFGASTGAASALGAAARLGNQIRTVVSRGGRPDLALEVLPDINIPVLLIVGGNDELVIDLNLKAQSKIKSVCELKIVPGATHLFSEPGKLEMVASETIKWFDKYLKEYN